MLSAKQQPSNIEHGGAIRPNVCKLTFGPPCIYNIMYIYNIKGQLYYVYIV